MSEKIHITKGGIVAYDWDGDIQQYVESKPPSLVRSLRVVTYIDADATLGDIFRAVEADKPLAALIGDYSWCDVAAFHREALRPPKEPQTLKYLLLQKYFEFSERGGSELVHFSGLGPPDEHTEMCTPDEDGNISWGLSLSPVNELASLPVRLHPSISIRQDLKTIGEAPCCFSLLDVLGEIYYEISFHGSPEARDEFGAGLKDAVEEIKNGTATLVPWDPDPEVVN